MSQPHRSPDRQERTTGLGQAVRLYAWHELHFSRLPALVGLVLTVEFLKVDGTPRFQRPLYLFWTGPQHVALVDLCQMYLWRFAIEHLFRFLKQHMGLNTARSPELACHELLTAPIPSTAHQSISGVLPARKGQAVILAPLKPYRE